MPTTTETAVGRLVELFGDLRGDVRELGKTVALQMDAIDNVAKHAQTKLDKASHSLRCHINHSCDKMNSIPVRRHECCNSCIPCTTTLHTAKMNSDQAIIENREMKRRMDEKDAEIQAMHIELAALNDRINDLVINS